MRYLRTTAPFPSVHIHRSDVPWGVVIQVMPGLFLACRRHEVVDYAIQPIRSPIYSSEDAAWAAVLAVELDAPDEPDAEGGVRR